MPLGGHGSVAHARLTARSALKFAAAGFTNLTGDHLEYHGTWKAVSREENCSRGTLGFNRSLGINVDRAKAADCSNLPNPINIIRVGPHGCGTDDFVSARED